MQKYLRYFFTLLCFLPSYGWTLNRDYKSDCDKEDTYQHYYKPYCLQHAPNNQETINVNLLSLIPAKEPKCSKCDQNSIYLGYLDPDFSKYNSHLITQLNYYKEHQNCTCYWPEASLEAAKINNKAYLLFRDLINNTSLSNLLTSEQQQRNFIKNQFWFLNLHGLTISLIAKQFRFSDYYHVCYDLENYAARTYDEREAAKIKDKLEDILEELYPMFSSLYKSCYKNHRSKSIQQEILFMEYLGKNAYEATNKSTR